MFWPGRKINIEMIEYLYDQENFTVFKQKSVLFNFIQFDYETEKLTGSKNIQKFFKKIFLL